MTELAVLEAAKADSIANQGDMEQLDTLFAIANFHARVGGKGDAYVAYDAVLAKSKVGRCDATRAPGERATWELQRSDALWARRGGAAARCVGIDRSRRITAPPVPALRPATAPPRPLGSVRVALFL